MHPNELTVGWNARRLLGVLGALAAAALWTSVAAAAKPAPASVTAARLVEGYVSIPMPPGFRVVVSELEGPVFADARGRTLYVWPFTKLRSGYAGETKGKPACYGEVRTETAGLMSPYPAGVLLPELDKRPSCTDLWPPLLASDEAKPVGKWTIVERKDKVRQWAYDEQPLYTSIRDHKPGDVLGGTTRRRGGDSSAVRVPLPAARQNTGDDDHALGPPPKLPPGFAVKTTVNGRLLTTDKNFSVYASDKDTVDKSMCDADCTRTWIPLLAPGTARAQGEWSVLERSPGVRQWVFRQQPLYVNVLETTGGHQWSLEGSDAPGWRNVYTQFAPPPPADFTVQDTIAGQVLADHRGRTIYTYVCADDSVDQLSCNHPDDIQVYRLAMCGGGDAQKCLQYWPYVLADKNAKGNSVWSVMQIDPKTGHRAAAGQSEALNVWAYRDRPVYTYGGDERAGAVNGAGTGEWRGQRNGLRAFWLRDAFFGGTL